MTDRSEPMISFQIETGVLYTSERQRQVAACMRRANSEFIDYSIAKLQRDGTMAPDWPVDIVVNVMRDAVTWSLVSKSGHLFSASYPENRAGRA